MEFRIVNTDVQPNKSAVCAIADLLKSMREKRQAISPAKANGRTDAGIVLSTGEKEEKHEN